MTDNEIVKALECCSKKGNCKGCPCYIDYEHTKCLEMKKGCLDLINRLQAENELLKEKHIEDNKLLNDRVIESVNAVSKAHLRYEKALEEKFKTAKAEAYKEFAERLKHKAINIGVNDSVVSKNVIDNLLKEMVGDNNAE